MTKNRMRLLTAVMFLLFKARGWSQVIVIANPSLKTSSASKAEIHEFFTGETTTFKDGSRIVPVLLRPGPIEDEFAATFIGKSDSAFRAAWRSLVFSGQAGMPRSLDSEKAMVDFVARTPGSLGFINRKTPHEGVKVLDIR